MGTKLTDTQTVSSTGTKAPATMTKFPEYGGTFTVQMEAGGTQTCTVQLKAWTNASDPSKEILATFVLPVVGGPKNGDLFDTLPVFATYDDWEWNVVAIGSSGTIRLSAVGVGV